MGFVVVMEVQYAARRDEIIRNSLHERHTQYVNVWRICTVTYGENWKGGVPFDLG